MGVIRPSPRKATRIKGGSKKGNNKKSSSTDLAGPSSKTESPTLNVSTTVNQKRPGGELSGGTAPKVQAIQDSGISSSSDMSSLPGTGKEMADIGGEDESSMVYEIDRPMSLFNNRENTYKKTHKFMTFGLAPNIVTSSTGTGSTLYIRAFLTSFMAEIPWHIPALYMNQSEFNLLDRGARCTHVSLEVYYRGTTLQFATASSATNLATLNQINDIAVAHGLNKSGQGSNVSYTGFDANETMIPISIAPPKYDAVGDTYRGMLQDYYGTDNGDPNFLNYIPHHQIGRQTFLYNYWAQTAHNNVVLGDVTKYQWGGWPTLSDKIEQLDGKTAVNTCVLKANYSPKMGMLKAPLVNVGHGIPFTSSSAGQVGIPCGGHLPGSRKATMDRVPPPTQQSGELTGPTETLGSMNNSTNTTVFDLYQPIEKSQFTRTGAWGEMDPHIQPSVHIGVQPVPALTTSATLTSSTEDGSWTDTRAYWEVTATMHTKEHDPTAYPWAIIPNVPVGDVIYFNQPANVPQINRSARNDGATFQGLYTDVAIAVGPDLE